MADDRDSGMAFTEDTDFEAGAWVNGEFFAKGRRGGGTRGFGERMSAAERAAAKDEARSSDRRAHAPQRPLDLPADFAKFAGVGAGADGGPAKSFAERYLERFGYKGRLGRYEQGTTSFVHVRARTGRTGLAFGGRSEFVPENAELERAFAGPAAATTEFDLVDSVTARDVVEELAATAGVAMLPHPLGANVKGRQAARLGAVTVLWTADALFAAPARVPASEAVAVTPAALLAMLSV
ncbi:hypothetical protein FNF28_04063 [Cafeteria roenbergensis]|uniref:G-patch domain-containing protein n=1 Tax=Cafeteria roenbergensis TaxID=33653 RepID=A0A5A8DF87_CAFRO|nr:hypothetical protein FNF28_04063 [Cafeteria roenbergensis]